MPFGMKNALVTFQCLINTVTSGLERCSAYIDDVVIYSDTWEQHLKHVHSVILRLIGAKLTVNLGKSEFGCAHIVYLGPIASWAGTS